jgi:putative molybdopterin biosynthesis protein
VLPGNPKGIHGLADLLKPGVTFINRQRGAGTRVLLDYQLKQLGITAEAISGYNQEEYTHLGVAAAVRSGRADCGLGIAAAAQALGLAYIPLFQERYDLVIPRQHFESALLAPVRSASLDSQFRQWVAALPGYETGQMGQVIAELE